MRNRGPSHGFGNTLGVGNTMRKIWNTLIYGDRKTKAYLWSIVLLLAIALGSCVMFVVSVSLWWIAGVLGGLIAAAVLAATVKFREIEAPELKTKSPTDSLNVQELSQRRTASGQYADTTTEDAVEETEEVSAEENAEFIRTLQKKQVKKLLYKYKVKKVHFPILLEECKERNLQECPAYIWVNKDRLQFLTLSAKTRKFDLPLSGLQTITVERSVRANPKQEYATIKSAKFVAKVFQALIPSYYIATDENGRRTHRKNCYLVGEDILVTNRSVRAVMELTQARFVLPEDEKMGKAYGTYTTEAYKLKFLCQDEVILPDEYKIKIRLLLQQMVEADISDYEFTKNLSMMVKKQLITDEYAKYYEDARLKRP